MGRRKGRGAARRTESGAGLQATRQGASNHKSLAKTLGPKGQKVLKMAQQAAKAGEFERAGGMLHELAAYLADEGKLEVAARAQLKAAQAMHKAGRDQEAVNGLKRALDYMAEAPNQRGAKKALKRMVERARSRGNDQFADRLMEEAKARFSAG